MKLVVMRSYFDMKGVQIVKCAHLRYHEFTVKPMDSDRTWHPQTRKKQIVCKLPLGELVRMRRKAPLK